MLSVTHVTCENKTNPIGIGERNPRISWVIQSDRRATMQKAYQIQVAKSPAYTDILWDSGNVDSDQSIHIEYGGPALQSRTRYYYRVRIWDAEQRSEWSEPAFWETGLLDASDWAAQWIAHSKHADPSTLYPCPMMRKTFSVQNEIAKATVYVSGAGLYELRLNGQKVGRDLLTPGWTSYKKRIQYQTYDITDDLRRGANAVGILLGEGWYKGNMTWFDQRNNYGDKVAALVQIHIRYQNGTEDTVVSDTSWKAADSPIRFSEIYHGEAYDAQLEKAGWDTADYDDCGWDATEAVQLGYDILVAQEGAPVRVMEEIRPVGILQTPAGETVLDMGQNMAGMLRFKIKGGKSDTIKLRHFEVLGDDGNVYLENLVLAKQTVEYTCSGHDAETFIPHFTYQGFRYVWLEAYPEPALSDFTGLVLYSDIETTGTFSCSNAMVNQLQQNILWSQKGNFIDIPTDCPQRSERLGWTGDVQIFAPTAAYNMDCNAFFSKWLYDLRADQKENGLVPWVVPDVVLQEQYPKEWLEDTGDTIPTSAAWGDAAVIVPWTLYQVYGDTRILRRQYGSMKAWVEYIRSKAEQEVLWNTGFHFGDWAALDTNPKNRFGATSTDFVATAYYACSTKLLAKTAKILGYEEYHEYHQLYKKIAAAFRREFVTKTGRLADQTQTAHALALMFDLVRKKDRQKTADRLAAMMKKNKYTLWAGFVGIPYLCFALSQNGHADTAMKLLLQTECPSWLYQITKGATTIWEYWNNDTFKASFNHYAYGSIGAWLYAVPGGITIDEDKPGYKHSILSPLLADEFDFVKTSIRTGYGMLKSEWKREDGSIEMAFTVPHNTTATVLLPDAKPSAVQESGTSLTEDTDGIQKIRKTPAGTELQLGSGSYSFRYPKAR